MATIEVSTPGLSVTQATALPGLIFETTWENDGTYFYSKTQDGSDYTIGNSPTGFMATKASAGDNDSWSGVPGAGVGGSVAMRIKYDETFVQPVMSQLLHLTGDKTKGYTNLHIRYHVKLPNNFRMGTSTSIPPFTAPYWKWGRLWQNMGTAADQPDGTLTENRIDSGYVVWNWSNGNPYLYGTQVAMSCQYSLATEFGSSGGQRYGSRYGASSTYKPFATSPGSYWDSVGNSDWEMDFTETGVGVGDLLNNTTQDWHTIEYQFQLRTDTNWGFCKVWFDGILQDPWEDIVAKGTPTTAPPPWTSSPTHRLIETTVLGAGTGWNGFVFFDNMQDWNAEWQLPGVGGYIDCNDLVVSTTRIGHTSEVNGVPGYIAQDDGSTPVPTL